MNMPGGNIAASIPPELLGQDEDPRTGGLRCPHCRFAGERRTSRAVSDTFREIYYSCPNPLCGHSWKASLAYDYGLSPSAIPDPKVDLPMRPMERADVIDDARRRSLPGPDPGQPTLFD